MIRILSTDLDGTLWDHDQPPPIAPGLFECIRRLQDNGTIWVLNTGRHLQILPELLQGLAPDLAPDFIVSEERYIHPRKDSGNRELAEWNARSQDAHHEILERHGTELHAICDEIRERFALKPVLHRDLLPFFAASTAEEADAIQGDLEPRITHLPNVILVRNARDFHFSHAGFTKGTTLSEVARIHGVEKNHILAAGDNYNDLPMLDGTHAGMVTAPANAVPRIKDAVRKTGGYISEQRCGFGILEALGHFSNIHPDSS